MAHQHEPASIGAVCPNATRRAKHLPLIRNYAKSPALCTKINCFPNFINDEITLPSRAHQRGRFAIATIRCAGSGGRDAGARRAATSRTAKPCGPDPRRWDQVPGHAISALRPKRGKPGTTEANKPGLWGEHGVTVKPLRRGSRDVPVGPVALAHVLRRMGCPCAAAHGIYGCIRHSAFPAPSSQ